MRIAVVGTGYVGLVTGACLSKMGLNVICVDNNIEKIKQLRDGIIPIYEHNLKEIVDEGIANKKLIFTSNIEKSVVESDVIFITVGTPSSEDGSADLVYVEAVARGIGKYINKYKVIVNKSTVPVGTGKKVKNWIHEEINKRSFLVDFDIVSNPEFLREGSAVRDFYYPDRIVIGAETLKSEKLMKEIYSEFEKNKVDFVSTNIETAEMIKYASNAFLAMKITFINEVANLCEKVGANVYHVSDAMGKDKRISPEFLNPGPGYGGSCFPKDALALIETGKKYGSPITLIEQTVKANDFQKKITADKICDTIGDLRNKKIAVLGLSFKPNTNDMREAPSVTILNQLAKKGCILRVYDPASMENARELLVNISEQITFCESEYDAARESSGLIVITEWEQFKRLDLEKIKEEMKDNYFFDLRNHYEKDKMIQLGFKYYGLGK